jgi:aminotransferase MxcL
MKTGIREFDICNENVEQIISAEPERFACIIIALPYKDIVKRETLLEIRKICNKYGVLLILDDIVTGFRLALGGAQEYYNFNADIVVLSKSLTGGAELAAICGKAAYMKVFEELYISTTMGGEITAIQCMINAINIYQTTDIIQRIQNLGNDLQVRVNSMASDILGREILFGYNCIPYLDMGSEVMTERMSELMMQNGIYMRKGCNFITGAHGQHDINYTVEVFKKILWKESF